VPAFRHVKLLHDKPEKPAAAAAAEEPTVRLDKPAVSPEQASELPDVLAAASTALKLGIQLKPQPLTSR
jgi:hypothetical protein